VGGLGGCPGAVSGGFLSGVFVRALGFGYIDTYFAADLTQVFFSFEKPQPYMLCFIQTTGLKALGFDYVFYTDSLQTLCSCHKTNIGAACWLICRVEGTGF
jgi:hypothetical protein